MASDVVIRGQPGRTRRISRPDRQMRFPWVIVSAVGPPAERGRYAPLDLMDSEPLPTAKQRELICNMIHSAFVEIRLLCWGGHAEQAADLADAFHNISIEMYGWGRFRWDNFRGMLASYQLKWRDESRMGGRDYVRMLDDIRRGV